MASSDGARPGAPVGADPAGGRWRSHDPTEAQHILSSVYAPHRLTVTDRSPFDFEFRLIDSPQLTAGFSTFRTDVTIDVPPPSTFYCLCLAPGGAVRTDSGRRSTAATATTATVLNADEEWRFADWSTTLMSVRIDRADLEDDLAAIAGRRVEKPLVFTEPLDLRHGAGREVGQILRTLPVPTEGSGAKASMHPVVADRLGALLRSAILVAFPHNHGDRLGTERQERVPQAVRRVIDAVEHDPLQVRTAADAARIAH